MMVCLFTIQSFYIVIRFVLQSYGKRHKKALGKAQKSVAEGESLKLVSYFYSILPLKVMSFRILESICGVMQRNEAMALSGRCSTMPGQRRSNWL